MHTIPEFNSDMYQKLFQAYLGLFRTVSDAPASTRITQEHLITAALDAYVVHFLDEGFSIEMLEAAIETLQTSINMQKEKRI